MTCTCTVYTYSTYVIFSGPPGRPNVVENTIGPDMVLVVVNPSSSGGLPTSYNVTISNSSYVYSNSTAAFLNGSAMVTFTGLTNSTSYTISAVAINCAGSSNPTTIYISCMYKVYCYMITSLWFNVRTLVSHATNILEWNTKSMPSYTWIMQQSFA